MRLRAIRLVVLFLVVVATACGETSLDAPPGGSVPVDASSSGPMDSSLAEGGVSEGATNLPPDGSKDGASLDGNAADAVAADGSGGPDSGAVVVTAFSGAYVYYRGASDNKRTIDATVAFPSMPLTFKSVTLNLALRCPPPADAGCDHWDRRAFLGVVHRVGTVQTVTEILRFMTPYGVGANWSLDVTGLRPLLSGSVDLRVFIDTWVASGSADGGGWLVDASFEFAPGTPARVPMAVLPLWDETAFDYGDPAKPVGMFVKPAAVTVPAGATSVELRTFVTGHGQGNLDNCAEFCARTHTFSVGAKSWPREVWRKDCATSTVPGQRGTFQYSRAGWCPGAIVFPWVEDVTAAVTPGQSASVSYDVAPYENTCRPDAPTCAGCSLGTGCPYDNGAHTKPVFIMSSALIAYGP